jgi:hypothetical protein
MGNCKRAELELEARLSPKGRGKLPTLTQNGQVASLFFGPSILPWLPGKTAILNHSLSSLITLS